MGKPSKKFHSQYVDWFQKYKALKLKIVERVQFHKENGIKKEFSTSKLCISFFKNTAFSKNALKIYQILENSEFFFFAFLVAIL